MNPLTPRELFISEYDAFGKKTEGSLYGSYSPVPLPGAIPNIANAPVNPGSDMNAQVMRETRNVSGVDYSGKLSFTDTTSGYRLGIDTDKIPKFYIGNNINSLLWDGTSLTIIGAINGGSLNINNKFIVDSSGNSTMKSYSLITQYTAGENLTIGRLGCFKNTQVTFGDFTQTATNRSTTASFSDMTYVDSSNGAVNYGTATLCKVGGNTGLAATYYTYGKFNLTGNPPGLPFWYEVDSVKLRIYIVFTHLDGTARQVFNLYRLTSTFSESTVTWNTKPTEGEVWATSQVCTPIASESVATDNTGGSTGYIEFDITDLYRLWSNGTYPNYGFSIHNNTGNVNWWELGGRTRAGGGDYNQEPFEVFIITKDNPGSGNTMVANDGKVYLASNNEYNRAKNMVGIIGTTVTTGQTVDVYSLADRSVIPLSVLSVSNGMVYYLNDTTGGIAPQTNDVLQSSKWTSRLGVGTSVGLMIDLDKNPLFIKQVSSPSGVLVPPSNARMAIVASSITNATTGISTSATNTVSKPFNTGDTVSLYVGDSGGLHYYNTHSASWTAGTSGVLSTVVGATVQWYK